MSVFNCCFYNRINKLHLIGTAKYNMKDINHIRMIGNVNLHYQKSDDDTLTNNRIKKMNKNNKVSFSTSINTKNNIVHRVMSSFNNKIFKKAVAWILLFGLKERTAMRLSKIDPSSFSEPEKLLHRHIDLYWNIDFNEHVISGHAIYKFEILENEIETILLDVSNISLEEISIISDSTEIPLNFYISDVVKGIGSKLTIELPTKTSGEFTLKIKYKTSPKAAGLLWLTPEQTLGKKHPYLFSQCQAIAARSLIPCQDTPAAKFTYRAEVNHPKELTALLAAVRVTSKDGKTIYEQNVPIQSYLLAIAVGDLVSKSVGPISKVWAEKEIIDFAAEEFSETPKMLQTASDICGEYVWKVYDILVMPPSFPFGGMENPCLTFVTPTVLAGDKSLADVVAHEISHSWTGNLVTNLNFEHFWLNEGFTVFVENKIVGRLHGDLAKDFHSILGLNELRDTIKTQLAATPKLQHLVVDLSNTSPEDAFSTVPYIKGSTFLRYLEDLLGGPESFEPFLRFYLNKYKYKSIQTDDFKATLYEYFRDKYETQLEQVDWDKWLYGAGMPPVIPTYNYSLADSAHNHAKLWMTSSVNDIRQSPLINEKLSTLQIIEFLSNLVNFDSIEHLSLDWINAIEKIYELNKTKNAEIRCRFIRLCIRARAMERIDEIIEFANSNFRMKFVRPIYRDMANWPQGKPIAIKNFLEVRDQMMAVAANQVAKDLGLE